MHTWGYNYLNEKKTLWKKEKLLVTSNFSFSCNVFSKNCLLLMRQNEYLWSKELTLSKQQILGSCKLKEFADENFKFNENGRKFSKTGRKYCGKKEKSLVRKLCALYQ